MAISSSHLLQVLCLSGLAVAADGASSDAQPSDQRTAADRANRGGQAGPTTADMENVKYYIYLMTVLGAIVACLLIYNVFILIVRYIRKITCVTNDTQRYHAASSPIYATIKQHLLYAPLFAKRHNGESRIAASLGTLPTRFQTLFLLAYIGTNIAFCLSSIEWDAKDTVMLAEFRNRTGILAVINMLPLFIMASRNNPLIRVLDMSYDTFNLMHRWFGRLVVLESVLHTLAYAVSKVRTSGWRGMGAAVSQSSFVLGGLLGTLALIIIVLQSPSPIRHAFYETFLHVHIALVILTVIGLWLHLRLLPQMALLIGAVALWGIERLARMCILIYRNVGQRRTRALVEILPGDAMRITIDMARPWKVYPGQHMFLYLPSVSLWMSHPFSVAWSEVKEELDGEKDHRSSGTDGQPSGRLTLSAVVRRRTGFTDQLYAKTQASVGARMVVNAFAEGPYGSAQNMHSYGTVMMFAGGVGITHQVPYVRDLVSGYANASIAARKVVLVWVIQTPEHLEWIRPWMTTILGMEKRRDVLRILLFVTRPRSKREIKSPSATVQMFPGKPKIEALIQMEVQDQIGAMAVSACGPGSLSDDVRQAVRRQQGQANIDYIEESYSW
ncbi:MAG: hypothetical protein M1817_004819 [Caeruleum heppii]|nr:MAG: hypothetical protein M1817_004819 [Caeruleum heppii]